MVGLGSGTFTELYNAKKVSRFWTG